MVVVEQSPNVGCVPWRRNGREEDTAGLQVLLHVYDVSQEEGIQRLNKVLANKYSPVKIGGVFHVGVEVDGVEWSYAQPDSELAPGVAYDIPRSCAEHHYRQTVRLKRTPFSKQQVADLIAELVEEYPGDDYDVLRRNCCHFAEELCQRLAVGRIPCWVHRLARVGALLDSWHCSLKRLRGKAGEDCLEAMLACEVTPFDMDTSFDLDSDDDDLSECCEPPMWWQEELRLINLLQGAWAHSSGGEITIELAEKSDHIIIDNPRAGKKSLPCSEFMQGRQFSYCGHVGNLDGRTINWSNGVAWKKHERNEKHGGA